MKATLQLNIPPMPLDAVGNRSPTAPKSIGEWRGLVARALGRSGISQKAAASEMGLTPQALSKQLAGAEHLSFWRMHSLPMAFWRELILLMIEFHDLTIGSTQQDAEDAAIGRLVREAVLRVRR